MADELDDILASGAGDVSREQIMKYLRGELSGDELHAIEKAMIESGMVADAVEGLQSLPTNQRIPAIEKELNAGLRNYLAKRSGRRSKRPIADLYWVIVAIIVILLIIVVTFAVIYVDRKMR